MIELNLIGTFNLNRLQAFHMSSNEPEDGERGVIIDTASIAAFEGQIGQVAYTAAKAGIAGMTLTMARDLGSLGIRVLAIAPSLFSTGITEGIPDEFAEVLTKDAAFPKRMGRPDGVRQARRRHRREPDAERLVHPPRRRATLRAEVDRGAGVGSMDLQLQVDVTEAAGLGEPAHVALTVTVPDALGTDPIVCFAKPGAGYSRRYFTEDLPGPAAGAQAAWHAERGWIFVSVDHLGVGDSSQHDSERLTLHARWWRRATPPKPRCCRSWRPAPWSTGSRRSSAR